MSYELAVSMLERRGVTIEAISGIVHTLQSAYYPDLALEECEASVIAVLGKREVQYTLMTGIALDELAEKKLLPQPLQAIMEADESLYGADETLALGITGVYGMIGLTGFGYLDKTKPGVIGMLNGRADAVHVFLDDLVAGIAAAASARIAHRHEGANVYIVSPDAAGS
ncbi:phosphatidylglycerophosphatase A [Paenibacillus sp. HN-1]|uniref:phosphatidylglycerophosphatase A family protein n=1 Tax=Paenibacillus TaxID=44249 RepID=UPI001CAA0D2B|nr:MULTISPECIES: phosphatidylglycerophosphatase A [Paenibacillus]MBY9080350.1 phosphatidylglycerophosphatase A [Paenibacillus sp. CGMCC 1.18879]MBY9082991.1 phosphatidylglycerophosphatase A [Paenibacillus sinensis]